MLILHNFTPSSFLKNLLLPFDSKTEQSVYPTLFLLSSACLLVFFFCFVYHDLVFGVYENKEREDLGMQSFRCLLKKKKKEKLS